MIYSYIFILWRQKIVYRFIIFITFATFFSMGITDNSRGPVYPDILQSFDIDTIRGSLIFTLASLSGLITNLFSKVWLFRFGVFKSSRFFLFMQFTGTATMALSSLAGSYALLIMSSIILGAGISGIGITGNVIIGNIANKKNGRRYFSFLHSMYGIASFLAPIIISFMKESEISWEYAILVISAFPLLFGLLSFKENGKLIEKENKIVYNILFRDGLLWGLIVSLYVAAEILISSRSVYIAQEVFNKTNQEASFYLSLFFVFLLSGRIIFSLIKFPGSNKNLILSSIILSLLFNLAGILYNPIFYFDGFFLIFLHLQFLE